MRRAQCAVCLAMLAVALAWLIGAGSAGSAPKEQAKPATTAPKAVTASWKTARPSLPDWAPKNPSAEFLRAARVLKPTPLDIMRAAGKSEAENAARVNGAIIMWIAAYEFFGTLSDKQIAQFLQIRQMVLPPGAPGKPPRHVRGNQIVVPVKQLTQRQRAALDRFFEAWREASKGQSLPGHPEFKDELLVLYKMGAKRDLSNVRVGFDTAQAGAGHDVSIIFYVTPPGGSTDWVASGFAQI